MTSSSAPTTASPASAAPSIWTPDALLLVSFGGPEAPDEVVPFLENVTRGTGIPKERLVNVGEHYFLFGGKSPINDQNRALIDALGAELTARGLDLPIFWGNRNWRPYIGEAMQQIADAGHHRVAVLTTSAYPSYSGCRSYREDLARALNQMSGNEMSGDEMSGNQMSGDEMSGSEASASDGAPVRLDLRRVGNYGLDESFVTANADAVRRRLAEHPGARLVFVTHSIPTPMNETSGPDGGAYLAWHQQVASRVADAVGASDFDLVFCSRSGRPGQPWLEPDVNDHLADLAGGGVGSVVLAPIGFVSDHMEVVYDLDTQARATCDELGIDMGRAATAGTDPGFVAGLVDRILACGTAEVGCAGGVCPSVCGAAVCCPNLRHPDAEAIA